MENQTPLMRSGPVFVTDKILGFRGHRYKISHIENLILKRPLLLMGMAIAALICGFVWVNADLLYLHEKAVAALAALAVLGLTWPLGTLEIHSRTLSTSHGSITWRYSDLAKAQQTVERVIAGDWKKEIEP